MADHFEVESGTEADNGQDCYQITEEGCISSLSTVNISLKPGFFSLTHSLQSDLRTCKVVCHDCMGDTRMQTQKSQHNGLSQGLVEFLKDLSP